MSITLHVNGTQHTIEAAPLTPLVEVLRETLGLRGTKVGCGNGECGACTVLIDRQAMCSCILPVQRAEGRSVTTIEGLAENGILTRVQQAFVDVHAIQCGFCTAGMIMSATALLDRLPHPSRDEVVAGLGGNICRCTGYAQIIEAVLAAAAAETAHDR